MDVISDVLHEGDCVILYPFPGLILFEIHVSSVSSHLCHNGHVVVPHSHIRSRILVRDCRRRGRGIPLGIHDPNVGWCLPMEEHSGDRSQNVLVNFLAEQYAFVST